MKHTSVSEADIRQLTHGPGWIVVTASNMRALDDVRDHLVEFYRKNVHDVDNIDQLRKHLPSVDDNIINELKISGSDAIPPLMVQAFEASILGIAGEKLLIQRRPHLMSNIPGRRTTATLPHIDVMSGISPYAFVLWAPLHDIDDDTGIYAIPQDDSIRMLESEHEQGRVMGEDVLNLNADNHIKMKYGEAVIFNPFVMHGSTINTTSAARICYNIRLQSQAKPLFFRNTEFYMRHEISMPTCEGAA